MDISSLIRLSCSSTVKKLANSVDPYEHQQFHSVHLISRKGISSGPGQQDSRLRIMYIYFRICVGICMCVCSVFVHSIRRTMPLSPEVHQESGAVCRRDLLQIHCSLLHCAIAKCTINVLLSLFQDHTCALCLMNLMDLYLCTCLYSYLGLYSHLYCDASWNLAPPSPAGRW